LDDKELCISFEQNEPLLKIPVATLFVARSPTITLGWWGAEMVGTTSTAP
jgi:hypothetical protein